MMSSIALIKHAVSRNYEMTKDAARDLDDTQTSLFAALECNASPVVIAGDASAFYRAHQAAAAVVAFQHAVNKSSRSYSSATDALDDALRLRSALDNLLSVAPYLVHVACNCPACTSPDAAHDDAAYDTAGVAIVADNDQPF
jgi:hypothetical protein